MSRPLVSISWWDWGRSGPQRRWSFPSTNRKRVSAQVSLGRVVFGAGRSYQDGKRYASVFIGRRRIGWREK